MVEIAGEENEPNDLLLITILYAGKDLYEEIHRNLFVSECEIAERLQNDGEQFINDLLIGCRHLQRNREIMDGIYDIVSEFQRLMARLEERFQVSEECDVHYTYPKSAPEGRGRPKLLIPKEQLEGLRSPTSYPGSFLYAKTRRKDPGCGWSRVTQILRDKLKFVLGWGGRGALCHKGKIF